MNRLVVLTVNEWDRRWRYRVHAVSLQTHSVVNRLVDRPIFRKCISPYIVGSCDGMICMYAPSNYEEGVLWNPAIRVRRPITCSSYTGSIVKAMGFGYDDSTSDYRMYIMHLFRNRDSETGVSRLGGYRMECYSMESGSWRELEQFRGMDVLFEDYTRGAYTNGTISWLVHRLGHGAQRNRHRILTLSLSSETVSFTELPSEVLDCDVANRTTVVDVIGDSVALFTNNVVGHRMNVWLLRALDGETSWVHFYAGCFQLAWAFDPLCIADQKLVCWRGEGIWNQIIWYDPRSYQRWVIQGIRRREYVRVSAAMYHETLVGMY